MKTFRFLVVVLFAICIFGNAVNAGDWPSNEMNAKAYSGGGVIVVADSSALAKKVFEDWQVSEPGNINTGNVDAYFLRGPGKTSLYMTWGYTDFNSKMLIKTIEYPEGMSMESVKKSVLKALAHQAIEKAAKNLAKEPEKEKKTIPIIPRDGNDPRGT